MTMECSPCDKQTKLPNAGVGIAVDKNLTVMKAEKIARYLNKHMKQGELISTLLT